MRRFTQLKREFLRLKHVVTYRNRYYDASPLVDLLYKNQDLFEYDILQNSNFYRGRIFNVEDVFDKGDYDTWVKDTTSPFQGYSKEESGAPPAKYATEGRLNAKGISYLYTCKDEKTVIYELRPTIEETVSVAEFLCKKNLRFADLTMLKANRIKEISRRLSDLLGLIAEEFSIPHNAGHNYYFTQYLAGHFANMGFDGIIFASSLNPRGENYVFFYPEDCEAINSKLYKVDYIDIKHQPVSRQEV